MAENLRSILPRDVERATLVGRIWLPEAGPVVVTVHAGALHDLSPIAPTVSDLLELDAPVAAIGHALRGGRAPRLAAIEEILDNSWEEARDPARPWLLAPCDLQAIKASGVTFVASLLERVIEEQARGDASRAEAIRASLATVLGDNLAGIVPGSEKAARVKEVLIAQGAWSQYLEVGIGPDAEIFTKAPVLAAVGAGADVGIHPKSKWNNPEPEIVLAVNSRGTTLGAALGNDVNVRKCDIALHVSGPDGFELEGKSSLSKISRDPLDLVSQAIGPNHAYPDGLMLFLGTMFAPTKDRHGPGQGFTHVVGDVVRVATPALGELVNRVVTSDQAARWTFGIGALMRSLARRGLL